MWLCPQEMEPPNTLQCELRSYQKQALHWMTQLEIGLTREDAAHTLHPCWEAYHFAEGSELAFYLNVFSGEATLDFPSALQTARGGILADAMGLGKTVMTISLILANPGRGGMDLPKIGKPSQEDPNSPSGLQLCLQEQSSIQSTNQIKDSKRSRSSAQRGGGTLIVCPMTLLGQWKTEFETHVVGGLMSVYAYYGHDRLRERSALTDHDIVLTTYGVLASEWSQPNFLEEGPLHSIHWYRVVLDEAHTIKAFRSNASQAVFQLTADRRWCLTGTPIQVHSHKQAILNSSTQLEGELSSAMSDIRTDSMRVLGNNKLSLYYVCCSLS
jgi:DNA repair protein RAD5